MIGITVLVVPQLAMAVITFDQLGEDIFVVSHRVKIFGSRGRALRLVYEKAASLCVTAGYTHFQIIDQESQAYQEREAANASIRVRFFLAEGDERIDCGSRAREEYVAQAAVKLDKRAYRRPDPTPAASTGAGAATGSCTVEQISAMTKVGLQAQQIKAVCK